MTTKRLEVFYPSFLIFAFSLALSICLIVYGQYQESICEKQHTPSVASIYCGFISLPYVIIILPIMIIGTIISANGSSTIGDRR